MSELKPCPIDVMKVRKLCYDGALRAYVEDEYIYLKDTVSGEVVWIGDTPTRRAKPNEPLTCEGCLYFVANEGLSVVENLGLMGIPLPAFLRKTLEAMRDKADGGEEKKV